MKESARTSREANKIWSKIKKGNPLPIPAPCPCCGSKDLYTGHHMSMELGVTCNNCGLMMSIGYPEKLTGKMYKEMDRSKSFPDLDKMCLWIAIEDWNKRT